MRRVNPSDVYYVNVDDNYPGLVEKLTIAEQFGFHMLAPGFFGFSEADLVADIKELISSDQAKGAVIILDTLKKFTDLMDKTRNSGFNQVMRNFVMKGGTVIGLAHVNKNRDARGKAVYAGTSDMIDDADCAYVLDVINEDDEEQTRTVEFENKKRRGNVADQAAYRYSTVRGQTYEALLDSVVSVDDGDVETVRQAETTRADQPVVDAVISCIKAGHTTRMDLIKETALLAMVSQRDVKKVLDRYTGTDPATCHWTCTIGQRGAKIYSLMTSETSA
jgi:hypothetical protein